MKFSTHSRNKRRGSILPLVAGAITTLLMATALAVDYSVLLSDKNQLQRACDSAALAGAAYLQRSNDPTTNQTEAENQALLVARQNNLAPTEMTADSITFPGDNNTKIHVVASRVRPLFFARVLGIVKGNITASATAAVSLGASPRVPIAITTTSKDRYQNDRLPHNFTLTVPQKTAFKPNYSNVAASFDPFTVFDLSDSQGKSGTQMQRQLAGDLTVPVNPQIGDQLTGMSLNAGTLAGDFQDGIAPRFAKAAQMPWLDPVTGALPLSSAWQLVGTRLPDVLAGASPRNPRIVSFVVVEELAQPESNHNFTIQSFADAYIHSVQMAPDGALTLTATFLPTAAANSSVSLIE